MTKLIHPELSYKIHGVFLDIHRQLGPMLPEEFYQKAGLIGLKRIGIECEREKAFLVSYKGKRVGLYFVDFWIEGGKILLELKSVQTIMHLHKAQAISYLKVTNADLAIVVNFGETDLTTERLPNFVRNRKPALTWNEQQPSETWLYGDLARHLVKILHEVHHELGPGFLHQVYRRATIFELRTAKCLFRYLKELPITYQGHTIGTHETRLLLIENKILLATIAVTAIDEAMKRRMKAFMQMLEVELGLIANFYQTELEISFIR
ncbi:MAG: GxxExxY protein [Caldilineaceae bacterium]